MNEQAMNEKPKLVGGCTGKGFVKGDPRIRRSGHPQSFYELRKLALKIAGERVVGPSGEMISRGELLLRTWVKSRHPVFQALFAEYAWGKPPEKIEAELQPKTVLRLYYAHELEAIEAEGLSDSRRLKDSDAADQHKSEVGNRALALRPDYGDKHD